MIYIEVLFGYINGNAIDVDAALSSTSTNPVQNKVINAAIEALKQQIENYIEELGFVEELLKDE